MEAKTKRTILKVVIFVLVVVLLVLFLKYVIFPFRSSPTETYGSYEELAEMLKETEFILPKKEFFDEYITTHHVEYGKRESKFSGVKLIGQMFSRRGVFALKKRYSIIMNTKKNNYGATMSATMIYDEELKKHQEYFNGLEIIGEIDGIEIRGTAEEFRFIVGNMTYEFRAFYPNAQILEDVHLIAKDLISKEKLR